MRAWKDFRRSEQAEDVTEVSNRQRVTVAGCCLKLYARIAESYSSCVFSHCVWLGLEAAIVQ